MKFPVTVYLSNNIAANMYTDDILIWYLYVQKNVYKWFINMVYTYKKCIEMI